MRLPAIALGIAAAVPGARLAMLDMQSVVAEDNGYGVCP